MNSGAGFPDNEETPRKSRKRQNGVGTGGKEKRESRGYEKERVGKNGPKIFEHGCAHNSLVVEQRHIPISRLL